MIPKRLPENNTNEYFSCKIRHNGSKAFRVDCFEEINEDTKEKNMRVSVFAYHDDYMRPRAIGFYGEHVYKENQVSLPGAGADWSYWQDSALLVREKGTGNLIRGGSTTGTYYFLGSTVYSFVPLFPIVSFFNAIANTGTPYPWAIDTENNIYLLNAGNVVLMHTRELMIDMEREQDPYYYWYHVMPKERRNDSRYERSCETKHLLDGLWGLRRS